MHRRSPFWITALLLNVALFLANPSLSAQEAKRTSSDPFVDLGAVLERAAGQSKPPAEQPFSTFQSTLDAAADFALKNVNSALLKHAGQQPASPPRNSEPHIAGIHLNQFARQYWGGRLEDLRQALNRLRQLRPVIESILRSEGVPTDLMAVVLVESAARPAAQSPREARGLWQFIPATARRYGLRVNQQTDERVDTEKATRAAARHLRDLYVRFGSWPLALAAYDAGEQAVQRAIEQEHSADFWNLRSKRLLPKETRDYVPAILAAMKLLGYSDAPSGAAETNKRNFKSQEAQVVYALPAPED
jgi:soluble lytic murein transglycosylase-like protein